MNFSFFRSVFSRELGMQEYEVGHTKRTQLGSFPGRIQLIYVGVTWPQLPYRARDRPVSQSKLATRGT